MGYYPRDLSDSPTEPSARPTLQWEEIKCLLCGGNRWQTLVEAPDNQGGTRLWFAVVQCHDCGLCFTNPRPRTGHLARFYPDNYRPHQCSRKQRGVLARAFHRERPPIEWLGQGRLLDFGCGGGGFLLRMAEHGWRVTGLDASREAVERARSQTGLDVLVGTLPHAALEPGSFDVITMWHALEHVPDPLAVLKEARRLLAPGGKLMIAVPNIDSLAFRTFGHAWFGLDLPRHLVHFAPWTLHIMLERSGFRVGRIRMVRHSSWLRHSARLACQSPEARPVHRLLRTKPVSRFTAAWSCLTGQSDCIMTSVTAA